MAACVAGGARVTEYGCMPVECQTEWGAEAAHKLASAYRPMAASRAAPTLQFASARAANEAATQRLASASATGGHRAAQGGALRAHQQQPPPPGAMLAFTEHSGEAGDLPLTRRTPYRQGELRDPHPQRSSPPHRQAPRLLAEARGGGGLRQKRAGHAGSSSESEGGGISRTDDDWELDASTYDYDAGGSMAGRESAMGQDEGQVWRHVQEPLADLE